MSRWPDPPGLAAAFYKAHGLGNDYLVFEEGDAWVAAPRAVTHVCDRYRGVGSDGIVVLGARRADGVFPLRMFNPDGSEFERSGNGLRVLASYLAGRGDTGPTFEVVVGGSQVRIVVHGRDGGSYDISVEMGRARTGPEAVELEPGALDDAGRMPGPGGRRLHVVPVSVGNPHMVVLTEDPSEERLAEVGPFLVDHPALAHGANVQVARARGASSCEARVWERGVGPTSASGTSACAVAVAMVSGGRLPPGEVEVVMPGGTMTVTVSVDLDVELRAPVEEVCTGSLTDGMLTALSG